MRSLDRAPYYWSNLPPLILVTPVFNEANFFPSFCSGWNFRRVRNRIGTDFPSDRLSIQSKPIRPHS